MLSSGALGELELESLVGRLVGPGHPEPMGIYVLRPDRPEAALALHVERTVFYEAFGNSPDLLAQEYDPYAAASVLLCAIDHQQRRPIGMMRIIVPSVAGLKSLNDIEAIWGEPFGNLFDRAGLDGNPEAMWDIATLAVSADYRSAALSGLVGMGLYQAMSMIASRRGVDQAVAVLHLPVLRLLQGKFVRPFTLFEGIEPRRYLDSSASLPVVCEVPAWHRRMAEQNETMYEIMAQGIGLEPVLRPPDWDAAESVVSAVTRLNGPPLRLL
jgi:hypothetical protein